MKRENSGFVIIELLVVLALIIPSLIMGTVTNAKEDAAVDSAYGYMRAVATSMDEIQIEDASKFTKQEEITFTVKEGGELLVTDGATLQINYVGSKPEDGGTLTYDKNGRVISGTLEIGGYKVTITDDKATVN